jgi:hypothetical protein
VTSGLNLRFEYTVSKTLTDTFQSSQTVYDQPIAGVVPKALPPLTCATGGKQPSMGDAARRGCTEGAAPMGGWYKMDHNGDHNLRYGSAHPLNRTQSDRQHSAQLAPQPCLRRAQQPTRPATFAAMAFMVHTSCFPIHPVGYFGNSGLLSPTARVSTIGILVSRSRSPAARRRTSGANGNVQRLNHAQFELPDGNAGDTMTFGRIFAARTPRLVQVALKLLW